MKPHVDTAEMLHGCATGVDDPPNQSCGVQPASCPIGSPTSAAAGHLNSSPLSHLASHLWEAHLSLMFARAAHRTIVKRTHHGPLRIQRPFYPENDVCHVYMLHPPGGVVSGDALTIGVTVEERAAAVITTPGAGRFYRSGGEKGSLLQTLTVNGGSLEWFPVETILFDGATAQMTTRIELSGGATFCGWDIQCFGRPAAQETFTHGDISNRIEVLRDGMPLLIERTRINQQHPLSRCTGHRGHNTQGLFIATLEERHLLDVIQKQCSLVEGACVTQTDGLLLVRYLGNSVNHGRALFIDLWQILRPVINKREACLPRIWAT